jgi:NAD-dependent dihydropyrimidine dehydrogenase PreA subunit
MTATRELPRLDPHVPRCGTPVRSRKARRRAVALIAVHLLVVVHVAHWKIAGSTLTPLEPSESMQTLELGYVNAGFVVFGLLLVATLVFGRFFCGWACHVVAYQDLCAWLLERAGLRPRPLRVRLLRLVPIGAALYMFVWPSVARAWSGGPDPELVTRFTTSSFWRTFPGPWMAALTIAVDGALVVWWMGAKGFCTYGCPYGALFGIADRLSPGRILVSDACEGCGHCTAVCTSNVRVHEEVATFGQVVDPGCMKCLDCVNSCPKQALRFGFGAPPLLARLRARVGSGARPPASSARPDLAWSEELLAALVFAGGFFAFHDLYGAVPLLLAIGLATLAAAAAVVVARALARADFRWQRSDWRVAGRFTRQGVLGVALALAYLLFAAHGGVVNYHAQRGESALERWLRDPKDAAARREAPAQLEAALAAGLFPDFRANNLLAVFHLRDDAPEKALPRMERALEIRPTAPLLVGLARIELRLGQRDRALDAARRALQLDPESAEAKAFLARESR